jgi:hypothetical protein
MIWSSGCIPTTVLIAPSGNSRRKNGPSELVWSEERQSRASAMSREHQIKRMKSAQWIRRELFNGRVPTVGINWRVTGSTDESG